MRHERSETNLRRRLGAAIAARVPAGLTVAQLAAAAELDDRQMARVLEGKSGLSIQSLRRVASALGCHPADLLREALPGNGTQRKRAV